MSNRLSPAARAAVLTPFRIFTGEKYRGTVHATDRIAARDLARRDFGLPQGWTVEAYAPGESPGDDPWDAAGGMEEHRSYRRRAY